MILQVDHLDVGYGAIKALHGVSLAINRGEIVALIGSQRPNGAQDCSHGWTVTASTPLAKPVATKTFPIRPNGAQDCSHGWSVTAATPLAKPVATKTFPIRPNGAQDCSHGWSVTAAQPADAQPVERDASLFRPGGAKEA